MYLALMCKLRGLCKYRNKYCKLNINLLIIPSCERQIWWLFTNHAMPCYKSSWCSGPGIEPGILVHPLSTMPCLVFKDISWTGILYWMAIFIGRKEDWCKNVVMIFIERKNSPTPPPSDTQLGISLSPNHHVWVLLSLSPLLFHLSTKLGEMHFHHYTMLCSS